MVHGSSSLLPPFSRRFSERNHGRCSGLPDLWAGSQLRDSAGFAPGFPFWTPGGVTMVAGYSI